MSHNSRLSGNLREMHRLIKLFPSEFDAKYGVHGGSGQQLIYDYSELDKKVEENFNELLRESETGQYTRQVDIPWKSAQQVRIHFFWGDRGQGKSSAMEKTAEDYYNEGLNIWHLWGARSYENLFWAVNMNCRKKYGEEALKQFTDEQRSQLEGRLHCDCHKAFPIMWIVPNYIDFDRDSLDRFNGRIWKDWDEYLEAVRNGWVSPDITREEKEKIMAGKMRKPDYLQPEKDMIKIAFIPIPKNIESQYSFKKAFVKAVLEARLERRVVVMNPQIFDGETDKFKVIAEIFRIMPNIAEEYFNELSALDVAQMRGIPIAPPRSEWTPQELSWGKILVVINELRTVAPNNKYSPQKGSSDSKRPIVDVIPELRHLRVWFMGDLQNPDDLNSSVRPQANNVVIKSATKDLLGQEWNSFFAQIEALRTKLFAQWGYENVKEKDDEKRVPLAVINMVNSRFPRIEELPKNKGYVVYRNGEFLLKTFDFPSFHHKKEGEKFRELTKIKWTVNEKKLGRGIGDTTENIENAKVNSKKENNTKALEKAIELYKEFGDWNKIPAELRKLEQTGGIPATENSSLTGKALSNKINRNEDLKKKLAKIKELIKIEKTV